MTAGVRRAKDEVFVDAEERYGRDVAIACARGTSRPAMSRFSRLLCCALFVSAQAFGGAYDDGVAAYDQGQYATALSLWLPLAEQGNVAAQYNVAVLYEKGLGVAQDYVAAARWYAKAAAQGDPEAQ